MRSFRKAKIIQFSDPEWPKMQTYRKYSNDILCRTIYWIEMIRIWTKRDYMKTQNGNIACNDHSYIYMTHKWESLI